MPDTFDLQRPEAAEKFLRQLPAATRQKGEAYFRQGAVKSLECSAPGTQYLARVQGTEGYEVQLFLDGEWDAECSCPVGMDCKHAYAAMKALLAEYNVLKVQRLSAGAASTGGKSGRGSPKPGSLAELLAAAVGRELRGTETKFIAKIEQLFARSQTRRQVLAWDLNELGLRAPGQSWDPVRLWPSPPNSAHEFWLYVANAAAEWGQPIPEFMAPVTDLSVVRNRVRHWRRGHDIEHWGKVLTLLQATPAIPATQVDLRLCFAEKEALLEWKRSGEEKFVVLRQTPARQLNEEWKRGEAVLTPEAEGLWQWFERRLALNLPVNLGYRDTEALLMLGRAVRQPALRERLVNAEGRPLAWEAAPLQWELQAPDHDDGDYTLRLTQADGSPVPRVLVALPGRPALLIAGDKIFTAPNTIEAVRLDGAVTIIPAKAMESPGGLDLLRRLRLEPPARLRERIRSVAVKVKFHCSIKESYPGSKSEQCVVRLLAQSDDGQIDEYWTGERWMQADTVVSQFGPVATVPRKPGRPKNQTVFYDRSVQAEATRLLDPLGLRWDGWMGHGCVRLTKKFPDVFVPWLKTMPSHIEVELEGELASLANAVVSGEVKLDVAEAGIDWFDLRVVLNVSDTELTQEELKLLLNARGGYVRLQGKGWRRLLFNLTEEEDERLARLGLNPRELSSEPQRLHALQLADDAAKKFLPEAQFDRVQRRAGEIQARVTPEVPSTVRAELRPYQRDGFHFLAYLSTNNFGGVLADDMGLGKTLQTLTWLTWLREQSRAGVSPVPQKQRGKAGETPALLSPSLVVCPKSVTDNWRAEAERFTPGLRVKVWGSGEFDSLLDHLKDADLHVLNYTQLRTIGEGLAPAQWLAVILDEGQYIKNPSSQTAMVARMLKAEHRLVLTGTPIENRLLDLWSLMAFAMPGALGSRAQFGRLFDAKEDPFARRRLAARVRPFLLRRTKTQVAKDLPDRIEEDLFCEIEGEQKTLYRAELKRAQQMLLRVQTQKQLNDERFNLLTSLLRLRQICCHPRLVKDDSKAESAKVEALLEQVEPLMEEGNKVLVFSQFVAMLELLKVALQDKGWPQFYLAGDTEDRGALVREFQATEGPAVFLISLKAGGFGLNLTAASYVVLFDPWWNPAVENQAIDRTHRIGQARKVIAYRLLIKDSIEEKIRALQKQKKALAEDVLGEEKFAQGLTLGDLQFLFAD